MKSHSWKFIFLGLSLLLTTGCPRPVTNNDNRIFNKSDNPGRSGNGAGAGPSASNGTSGGGSQAPAASGGGTINGGGGKGVRCTKNGKTTVELLDLYEGRAIYGLTPLDLGNDEAKARAAFAKIFAIHGNGPGNFILDKYSDAIDKYADAIDKYLIQKDIVDKMHFVESPTTLKPVQDDFAPLLDKDCEMVQVALYYDESSLLVDHSLWNQLDVTNRTALIAHELIYAFARGQGITNSVSSRKLVAFLFSKQSTPPLFDGIPYSDFHKVFHCSIEQDQVRMNDFYMLAKKGQDHGEDSLYIAFGGGLLNPYMVKTSATLEHLDLRQLVSKRPYSFPLNGGLDVTGYPGMGDISFQFLGTSESRSRLSGSVSAVIPGKTGAPGKWNFTCDPPDDLASVLPSLGIAEGEYHSKNQIRGIYQETLTIDHVGGIKIVHEAQFKTKDGQDDSCRWTETGMAEKSGNSLTLLKESAEMNSRDDVDSICLTEFKSAQEKLKAEGYLAYALNMQDYTGSQTKSDK
jgi:hypothetical protein